MKKQIIAIPKRKFDLIHDSYIEERDDIAFISILDPDNNEKKFGDHPNFLQVKMWDIEQPITALDGFVFEPAGDDVIEAIVKFITANEDKHFIVHCSGGVSRSGAVVKYIFFKYHDNVDIGAYYADNMNIQPNHYIFKQLAAAGGLYDNL